MNLKLISRAAAVVIVIAVMAAYMLGFQVRQNEKAVVTRFGSPVRVINDPGLYFKWPWPVDRVNRFDTRLNFYEIRVSEALTRDKRNVILPIFVAWKIDDAKKFLEALGDVSNAQNKLDSVVSSAKNTVLGTYDFNQLISTNPDEIKIAELENKIASTSSQQTESSFGIDIQQVGIERVDLPEANTSYVFERMRAERAQFADRYRAEGQQQADSITAKTDAEKAKILADAQRDAEETKGKAEAEAAHIYAAAHSQDPEFYKFLRELDTLKKVVNENTTLVIDANSPPFDVLKPALTAPTPQPSPAAK
ncbi:MAG: protease modulator HflC [Chthoniobacteraceae bacterium]